MGTLSVNQSSDVACLPSLQVMSCTRSQSQQAGAAPSCKRTWCLGHPSKANFTHRPPPANYLSLCTPAPSFQSSLFLFFSPSKCRGFTCISEDSSEITFLLVENYIPDRSHLASAGWGIFSNKNSSYETSFFSPIFFHCQRFLGLIQKCGEEG